MLVKSGLKILFLFTYHTQAKDIAVVKSGTRNDFRSSCLYDTLNKLSPWHTFSNMAKIKPPWFTFSNMAKIRYYFLWTIIGNRNWNKITKVAFLSEVQNFFAGCVMVTLLFLILFKCVSLWQEGVSLWLVICHHDTQRMFSHFTLVLESELSSVLLKLASELLDFLIYQFLINQPKPIIRTGVTVPNVQKLIMVAAFSLYLFFITSYQSVLSVLTCFYSRLF